MFARRIGHAILAGLLYVVGGYPGAVLADDAEIYVGESPDSRPYIMFSLDYRPNTGSQVCNDYVRDCKEIFDASGFPPEDTSDVSFFELLRAALAVVMKEVSGVNVGIMLNHNDSMTGSCQAGEPKAGCSNGGYIALDFVPLYGEDEELNRDLFSAVLGTMPAPRGGLSHLYQGRELFFEFYRYMKGLSVFNGHMGYTSYDQGPGQIPGTKNIVEEHGWRWSAAELPLEKNYPELVEALARHAGFAPDPVAQDPLGTGPYRAPRPDAGVCSRVYTVNFMFRVSNQDANSEDEIACTIPVLPSSRAKGCPPKQGGAPGGAGDFSEMLRHLNQEGVGPSPGSDRVTSYFFVDPRFVDRTTTGYAIAGGSNSARPLSADPQKLVEDFKKLFDEILSVSTTFVSAALPINTFDRAQLRPEVFLALFQPQLEGAVEGQPLPVGPVGKNSYWWGNVKKLRLAGLDSVSDIPRLEDARGVLAVDADGRIANSALTFWTVSDAHDVMEPLRDKGNTLAEAGRDGRSVNRGGMGHRVPGFQQADPHGTPTRTLYYDKGPADLFPLTKSEAGEIIDDVGAASLDPDERLDAAEKVVSYLRGFYPDDANEPGTPLNWMTASVMHSRPATINYGAPSGSDHTPENPLVYLAFGSNDGTFRFVRNTAPGDAAEQKTNTAIHVGKEAWAFAPRATMAAARRIFLDDGDVRFPFESTVYGVDGPPTVWIEDRNGNGTVEVDGGDTADDGDKAYVFFGLRRGGRAYYGLDVSRPESPRLMWSIDGENGGDFASLGLTFSQPAVGYVRLSSSEPPKLVLIFGGGFDRQYDGDGVPTGTPSGVGIYVVDALTGARLGGSGTGPSISHSGMLDSIPSAVAAVDANYNDGLLDRLYVGDLGGNVWRVDIPVGGSVDEWPVTRLAQLGRHAPASSGAQHDRRFFHRPDVVLADAFTDASGATLVQPFDAVIIGSGDRENPKDFDAENYMFMLRDRTTGIRQTQASATDEDIVLGTLENVIDAPSTAVPIGSDMDGWRLLLDAPGEKALSTPLTIANTVLFTTYLPEVEAPVGELSCGPIEGKGRFYAVSLQNASPFVNRDRPIDNWDETARHEDRYTLLNSGGIPAEVVLLKANQVLRPDLTIEPLPVSARWRSFWHVDEVPTN